MLIVITITFFLMKATPGGPFDKEKKVPTEVLAALNARYKLDQPLYVQYLDTLTNIVKGDFAVCATQDGGVWFVECFQW